MICVPAQKLSIALEQPVFQAARQAAQRRGMSLSAWLNEASRKALAIEDGLIGVAEWEAESGRPSKEDLTAADAVLDKASIGPHLGTFQADVSIARAADQEQPAARSFCDR